MKQAAALTALCIALFLLGCGGAQHRPLTPATELVISPEAAARARAELERARAAEPALTAVLRAGADKRDLELHGLVHRLKTLESLERKIQTLMDRDGLPAADIVVEDVLRYTVLIEESPPGTYEATVAEILATAERGGDRIIKVKNYWPPGDSYSGINSVWETPDGLLLELQFHTVGSLAATQEGHPFYEKLRQPETPLEEKRRLFDRLVERWDWVAVPEGILESDRVHPKEEVLKHERP